MSLFFISGPHGGGKTTLLTKLAQQNILRPELVTTSVKIHTNPYERLMLKTCQKALENYEAREVAQANPLQTVIANRCVYDTFAYADAYRALGWISAREHARVYRTARTLFSEAPRAIILNPPFDVVWSRLQKRWKHAEKKWGEENPDYCRAACAAYEQFASHPHVLYLTDNTNTKQLSTWLAQ